MKMRTLFICMVIMAGVMYVLLVVKVPISHGVQNEHANKAMTSSQISGTELLNVNINKTELGREDNVCGDGVILIRDNNITGSISISQHFLTKANVKMGMGIHYKQSPASVYKISPQLYSILPERAPFQNNLFNTCLLVGNSASYDVNNHDCREPIYELLLTCSMDIYDKMTTNFDIALVQLTYQDLLMHHSNIAEQHVAVVTFI
ncbi:uncharacterized protein LOC144453117 [Glandiceps talaboti]